MSTSSAAASTSINKGGIWLLRSNCSTGAEVMELCAEAELPDLLAAWAPPNFIDSGWVQQSFLPVDLRERLIPKKHGIISYEPA